MPAISENNFAIEYLPELDKYPVLEALLVSYCQYKISILRYTVELGIIDINTEVSLLSFQLELLWEENLDALFHIFKYLMHKYNSRLAFGPTYPDIDMSVFKECDWEKFYRNQMEEITTNSPELRFK